MNIAIQLVVFAVMAVLTVRVYQAVLSVRKDISCHTVMMASMIAGSMNGLIGGTILALNQGFSVNSILAMIIGIGSGAIIGILFNAMTMLEGIMGGVMGGLMGAMLGEMLLTSYVFILSFILIIIAGISVFLLEQRIKEEAGILEQAQIDGRKIRRLSIFVVCTTVVLFSAVLAGDFYKSHDHIPNPNDHAHNHEHM